MRNQEVAKDQNLKQPVPDYIVVCSSGSRGDLWTIQNPSGLVELPSLNTSQNVVDVLVVPYPLPIGI